jgi:predicted nucleic acid-binding protein
MAGYVSLHIALAGWQTSKHHGLDHLSLRGIRAVLPHGSRVARTIHPAGDLMIASHARSLSVPLITNNVREFKKVSGLKVENWI